MPAVAIAQADQQPVTTLKVQAREVLLPVTVRDKKGEMVTNLTAADFTLTEDSRPQVIKSFTRESNLPFRVGLLVDTSRSVSSAMENERKAGGKFVDLMLPADPKSAKQADQAFLIHFDHEVELLEDFTNSRDKLHHELDDMGPTSHEHNDTQGPETSGDDRERQRGSRGGGTQLYDAIYLAADDLMKPKDGRKALVVFSDGADRGSKETLNDAIDAADRANVSIYTIYFKGEEQRDSSNGFPGQGGRRGGMGGGWPGGGGGGYPAAAAVIRAEAAASGAAVIRDRPPALTARRSWRRLPPAPAAASLRPRRKKPRRHLRPDRRRAARPVPAHLHP